MNAAQVVARAMSKHNQTLAKLGPALEQFRNRHAGQAGLLLGNGPSLLHHDLGSVPANVVTIGMNGSWRVHETPTYHVCVDDGPHYRAAGLTPEHLGKLTEEERAKIRHTGNGAWWFDAQAARGALFTTAVWPVGIPLPFANPGALPEAFSPDPAACGVLVSLDGCGSVMYVALQLACFMGLDPIYLAGFDQAGGKFTGQTAVGDQGRLFRHTPEWVRERVRAIEPSATKVFRVVPWPWR